MTKGMKIKRLKKQNDYLIKQNMKLRKKIPAAKYAKRIDEDLEKFDRINDDLVKLYKQLHKCVLKRKMVDWKYRLGIFEIKVKRFFGI